MNHVPSHDLGDVAGRLPMARFSSLRRVKAAQSDLRPSDPERVTADELRDGPINRRVGQSRGGKEGKKGGDKHISHAAGLPRRCNRVNWAIW